MKGRANFTSFIEFPSARNWKGYYAYSSRGREGNYAYL
jgi:hypothetical protein